MFGPKVNPGKSSLHKNYHLKDHFEVWHSE